MNLLILSNNPDRSSFRQRIEIYLDILRDNGINCEIAVLPPGWLARRNLFKSALKFDAVLLHKKCLNPFDAFVLRRWARKVIYDFDDAVMYSDKHPSTPNPKRLRDFQRTVELADLVIAGNVYLAEHARRFNGNVKVLPTGLDISEYDIKITRLNDGKIRLVWIGSKVTIPYLKEITPALEEIGSRLKNVVLRVISDEFIEPNNTKIEKIAWSQQTQARDLAECDIGLAPLSDNLFTRGKCGFKILQYAAAGLPTVASPVGVNAELITNGSNGYLAVSHRDWVDCVSRLIQDSNLRKQIGAKARQTVRGFDSKRLGSRLAELIRSVTS